MKIMKVVDKEKTSNPVEHLRVLFETREGRAVSERFIQKAIKSYRENLNSRDPEGVDNQEEVLGSLSDHDLIDLLAEGIYLETLIDACESKISAAKWRYMMVIRTIFALFFMELADLGKKRLTQKQWMRRS